MITGNTGLLVQIKHMLLVLVTVVIVSFTTPSPLDHILGNFLLLKKKKKDAGNFPGYQQVNFQSGILPANSVNILCPAELVLEMLRQIPKTSDSYLRMAELRLS